MFYDLNVPWTTNKTELQQRVDFLAELGYNIIALSTTLPYPVPANLTSSIPKALPITKPSRIRKLLTRVTVPLEDPTNNPRIAEIRPQYDILAVRPKDERTLQQACNTVDCDLISLDLSLRHAYPFKHRTFAAALARGVKFELCYGKSMYSETTGNGEVRKNVWQNAANIVRATRGRGIVVSSAAESALGCRGPWDVVNLAVIWGLKQDLAKEAVSEAARSVVAASQLRTRSYRGVIDVVVGGTKRMRDQEEKVTAEAKKSKMATEKVTETNSKEPDTKSNAKKRKSQEKSDRIEDTPTKPPDKKPKTQPNGTHKTKQGDSTETKDEESEPMEEIENSIPNPTSKVKAKTKAAHQAEKAVNMAQFKDQMDEIETAAREGREPADEAKLKTTPGKVPNKRGGRRGKQK